MSSLKNRSSSYVMQFGRILTFRRNVSPPGPYFRLLLADFLLGLFFDPNDGKGSMFPWNVELLPTCRTYSSYSPLGQPQIQHVSYGEGNYATVWASHAAQHATERTQPTNSNTHAHRRNLLINNRRQQFTFPIVLTTNDDHIGRNMQTS
jgi:hypothetical protein